jgi:hypothetical protein
MVGMKGGGVKLQKQKRSINNSREKVKEKKKENGPAQNVFFVSCQPARPVALAGRGDYRFATHFRHRLNHRKF